MFFLVTGASGVGKSTVRRLVEPELAGLVETAELTDGGVTPEWNIAWRHRMVERVVRRAITAQGAGKHFLLCGDPVPPGEVLAAPSADQLRGLEVCLLDASAEAQQARLLARGDDPALVPLHLAFAEWMRGHVADHRHRPEVLLQDAWPEMRWDRWLRAEQVALPWGTHVIDTSQRTPLEVSRLVAAWVREHAGQ